MSLSGSSASRNSICAMTRLASSSSMNVGKKMIRSLSRREKMSNARSPRGVCSMTMGTRAITASPSLTRSRRTNGCVFDEEVERLALAEPQAERLEITAFLHHTPYGRCGALARAGDLLHLGLDVVLAGREPLFVGDRLQQQRALDPLLRAGPQLAHELGHVPRNLVGIHALAPQALACVLDLVRDLSHDHGVRHGELVALQHGTHDLVFQLPTLLGIASRLQLTTDLGAQRLQCLELTQRLREVIVERGQDLLLDLGDFQACP